MRSVLVLADDLIWMSRLVAAVERAGASALRAAGEAQLRATLEAGPDAVIVDLNGRTYDGVEAVRLAAEAGRPTIAVGQHEDLELRRRALAAGAQRVYSYNKIFTDGPAVIGRLLDAEAQPVQ